MKRVKIGVVCGRFHVFHNDHLKYVLAAKDYSEHLLVGITSSDPSVSLQEKSDQNRGTRGANPCTYYERMEIIKQVLLDVGLSCKEFDIIPFPIGKPELVKFYIPSYATCFFTIYDKWGEDKVRRMQKEGYNTEILWKSDIKGLSSTLIREKILNGEDWEKYVPSAVYTYMKQNQIDERIRKIMMESKREG